MPDGYPTYGNEQAMMTMNRAAYGDVAAGMMGGASTVYGGASSGMQNMMSDIGQYVMPVTYTPPARTYVGSYGQYQQHTGLIRGLAGMVGMESTPRGTTAMEHMTMSAGDVGERVGGGLASAATTIGGLAGGFAATGAFKFAGSALGSTLGPVGGALGGFAGMMAAPMAGLMAAQAVGTAVNQRREIQSFLEAGSFRFVGAGSAMADPRLGGGMSREARREAAEFIRSEDISSRHFNTEDLTQILQGSAQLGMMAGTNDMEDFKSKFREIKESVKTVTKVLHQTLSEGLQTIKDMKAIGVSPGEVSGFVMQADAAGRVAGRTGAEMMGIGMQGAEMFRGTGVSMQAGFQMNVMNTAAIRAARDAGVLAGEAVAQAGGETALAQRMTASSLAFSQSQMGRGFGAAFFDPSGGGAGFNAAAFNQQMMGGGGDFIGNAMSAANNLSNPAGLIKYQANQEKFMSEMAKSMGGQGLMIGQMGASASYAQYISQTTGANVEDAFRLAMKQQGLGAPEIEARMGMIQNAPGAFTSGQASAAATRDKMVVEEAQQNFVFNRMGAAVGDKLKSVVDLAAKPLNKFIDDTAESFTRFKEEQLYGVQRVNIRGIDLTGVTTGGGSVERVKKVNLDRGGTLSRTAGEAMATAIEDSALAQELGIKLGTGGDVILNERAVSPTLAGLGGPAGQIANLIGLAKGPQTVDREQLETLARATAPFMMTQGQAQDLDKSGALKGMKGKIGMAMLEGRLDTVKTAQGLAQAVFGKEAADLSEEEAATLILETKGTPMEKVIKDARHLGATVRNATEAMSIDELKTMKGRFEERRADLGAHVSDQIGSSFEFAPGVVEKLARAEELAGTDAEAAEKLRAEAAMQQIRTGDVKDMEKVRKAIRAAGTGAGVEKLKSVSASLRGIMAIQTQRGTSIMSQAITADLMTKEGVELPGKDREQIKDLAGQLGGPSGLERLMTLSEDEAEVLGKTKTGAALMARKKSFETLSNLETGTDLKSAREAIVKITGDRDPGKVQALLETFESGGGRAAARQAFEGFMAQSAGPGGVAAAGGTAIEAGGASASQQFATQTSINTQVLAALQGIAGRLRVQQ